MEKFLTDKRKVKDDIPTSRQGKVSLSGRALI